MPWWRPKAKAAEPKVNQAEFFDGLEGLRVTCITHDPDGLTRFHRGIIRNGQASFIASGKVEAGQVIWWAGECE